ncbi:MAG TPA: hypothetical protein VL362_02935 [Patescibacteria group bacterium]|jgi:hypothetical protein|nr:hypothetical protein [Patescibacteria group bacterium]
MTELIIPGADRPTPTSLFIADERGRSVEVPVEELWQVMPDAAGEGISIRGLQQSLATSETEDEGEEI